VRHLTAGGASTLLAVTLLAATPAADAAVSAPTATIVGSTANSSGVCTNATIATTKTGAGEPSYVVPTDGVITSFSTMANAATGAQVRMVLFAPPTGNTYPVAAKTPVRALIPSVLNSFEVRIPVRAGWLLGGRFIGSNVACSGSGSPSVTSGIDLTSSDLDTASEVTLTPLGTLLTDLSAVLEPDADHDGFGDVSQDGCPVSALAQAACPDPETTITKAPRKKSSKRKVTLAFTSSVPGSLFLVTVDGKKPVASLSPFVRELGYGKHRISVQAVSPLSPADPTPASVAFKIKQKR